MPKTYTGPQTQSLANPSCALVKNTGASVAAATDAAPPVPTNVVLFATAGPEGSVIKRLTAQSDDSSARILQLWQSKDAGTTFQLLGAVNIPANAGTGSGTTVAVDLLANTVLIGLSYDQMGKPVLQLAPSVRIYAGTTTAITTLKHLSLTGEQEDF